MLSNGNRYLSSSHCSEKGCDAVLKVLQNEKILYAGNNMGGCACRNEVVVLASAISSKNCTDAMQQCIGENETSNDDLHDSPVVVIHDLPLISMW